MNNHGLSRVAQFKFDFCLLRLLIKRFPHGNTVDRWILESKIIRNIAFSKDRSRIISVGVSWTSKDYFNFFDVGTAKVFKTVDPFYVSSDRENHFTCRFEQLELEEFYDVILLNGVFGYGTDSFQEVETIFQQCVNLLSPTGVVVVGAKAVNGRIQSPNFDIYEIANSFGFQPAKIPGLNVSFFATSHQNGHSFWAFEFR
jgi:hypothetical protein